MGLVCSLFGVGDREDDDEERERLRTGDFSGCVFFTSGEGERSFSGYFFAGVFSGEDILAGTGDREAEELAAFWPRAGDLDLELLEEDDDCLLLQKCKTGISNKQL